MILGILGLKYTRLWDEKVKIVIDIIDAICEKKHFLGVGGVGGIFPDISWIYCSNFGVAHKCIILDHENCHRKYGGF